MFRRMRITAKGVPPVYVHSSGLNRSASEGTFAGVRPARLNECDSSNEQDRRRQRFRRQFELPTAHIKISERGAV